jgi:hypothetical protein
MPLLVSSLVANLTTLTGGFAAAASLDPGVYLITLANSARELGVNLADPLTVTDDDLAGVTQGQVTQLLEVAEVRVMEAALQSSALVDQKIGTESIAYGQFRTGLEAAIARKAKYLETRYGIGLGTMTGGTVNLRFQEDLCRFDDCEPCP